MKIENIDTTLEEIQEVGEQMRVINEAISQPVGGFQVGKACPPPLLRGLLPWGCSSIRTSCMCHVCSNSDSAKSNSVSEREQPGAPQGSWHPHCMGCTSSRDHAPSGQGGLCVPSTDSSINSSLVKAPAMFMLIFDTVCMLLHLYL